MYIYIYIEGLGFLQVRGTLWGQAFESRQLYSVIHSGVPLCMETTIWAYSKTPMLSLLVTIGDFKI